MKWLRLYHDTITDHKWRVVANESRQPEANVLAVWMHMLINASDSSERGTLEGWNDVVVAAGLGIPTEAVTDIREAMQGWVLDGLRLTGWEKRQRQSDDAGGRQRKTRERREPKPPGGDGNGHDPEHSATVGENAATVARQTENVARHSNGVAGLSLRAQTPDLEKKEDSEAVASVAGATVSGGNVLALPVTAQGELFGPVLADLVAAVPNVDQRNIRSQLGKACGHLGPDVALALAKQALLRAEPWSWLCKTIAERTKPAAGGRPAKAQPDAVERLLQRQAEEQEKFDLRGAL